MSLVRLWRTQTYTQHKSKWKRYKLVPCNIQLFIQCLPHAKVQAVSYSMLAHHSRGASSGSQGCAWEGVKRGAGIKLFWTEILWAFTFTIAEPTADRAALVPTETKQGIVLIHVQALQIKKEMGKVGSHLSTVSNLWRPHAQTSQ